jgi:hypothetical protein
MGVVKEKVQSFLDSLETNGAVDDDARRLLGKGLFSKLPSADLKSLIGSMTVEMPTVDKTDLAQKTVSQLPDENKANVLKQTIEELPEAERKDVASVAARQPALPVPDNGKTLDFLWKIIVTTFCIVLIGTVTALISSMYRAPADGGAKPELVLAIITTVIGFLAGLVSPSPVQKS